MYMTIVNMLNTKLKVVDLIHCDLFFEGYKTMHIFGNLLITMLPVCLKYLSMLINLTKLPI